MREVLAAAEDQDPIAALGMINPGESRGADEVWEALHQRLERAGVTTKDGVFDAAGVSFEDVELEVDEVADHVAKVHLREGTVKLSLEADDFPKAFDRLAAEARAELGDSWTETYDIAELADEMRSYDWEDDEQTRMGLFVMVIEVDGRWYVSPTATWTEYAAHQIFGRGGDWSAYDEGVDRDPVGGERPEEALRAFAEVANSDDLEALLDGLPHGQGDLFRPFVGLVEEELARYGAGFDIELRDQTVRAGDEDDGLVRLDIDRIELGVTGVEDGDPYRNAVGLDGSCGWAEAYDGSRADGCVPTWLTQVSGIDNAFVMVRETDDVWQIDLFATAVAWLEELATNVPDDELDSLVAAIDEGDGARWLEHRLG
ncbi:hypothetical protein [Nocardioides alcanivorans]|uniref:hypothetical protein n=1 Tax=Nocardioides alcanivorans TaxID=2897352 RepID=UPI001F1D4FF6|nr:hypothetical protein [Nocardioides alcanivorans]